MPPINRKISVRIVFHPTTMCICALDSRPEKVEKKDNKSSEVTSAGDRKSSSTNKATADGAKQSSNENGDVKSTAAAEKKDDSKKSGNDKDDRLVFLPKKKKCSFWMRFSHTNTYFMLWESWQASKSDWGNILKISSSSEWSQLKCVLNAR